MDEKILGRKLNRAKSIAQPPFALSRRRTCAVLGHTTRDFPSFELGRNGHPAGVLERHGGSTAPS